MNRYFILVSVLVQFLFVVSQERKINKENLPPVIMVPGDGGSQIEAKLDKPSTVQSNCDKTTEDFFTLWLDVKSLLPYFIGCWADNAKLNYNETSNTTYNQPGVETRVRNFGDPGVVEYLDPKSRPLVAGYFNKIVSNLVSLGYVRSKNIFGAPYDFRKGPSELGVFFKNLTTLVETAYQDNGNIPVVLLAHSLGGPLSLIFLKSKSQRWKDKYIKSLVSLAGAYGGSMKSVSNFAAGDDFSVFFVDETKFGSVIATMPSTAFLLPNEQLWDGEVLVSTVNKDYTHRNLQEFFDDLALPTGWKMYQNEKVFVRDLSPPGVEVHCLYGKGLSTIKKLVYNLNSFPDDPMYTYESGDGTVNLRSLEVCKKWINRQKQEVHTAGYEGVDHMGILSTNEPTLYLINKLVEWSNGQ